MYSIRKYSFATLPLLALYFTLIAFAQADTTTAPCPYSWTQDLQVGSAGDDVLKLQQFLNSDLNTQIAVSGAGSPGNESTSYGLRTKQAVAKLQEKYAADILYPIGLVKGTGSVGMKTRTKLNALCTTSTTTAAVQITLSDAEILTITDPTQPAATLAPPGAGGVPFTTITLTAGSKDVDVQSITVERTGPGSDGSFDSISLTDENGDGIGGDEHFDSNHQTVFREPFTIPAHTSKTLTILGNMANELTDYAGQTPIIQINVIDTSASVVGTLPFKGTAQTINDSLIIGGATAMLSQYDPDTNTNRYINDTDIRFSGIRITANSQEDLTLDSITWDQGGTAGNSDISNVVTFVNGTPYPTEMVDHSYTSTFFPGIVIPKGRSIDAYIQGDLTTGGSNRTVEFDIGGSDDIALTGNTFGYGVGISAQGNTAVSGNSVFITSDGSPDGDEGGPFYAGSVVTINGSAVTSIGKAN
ncbi:MAG: hypothetical protein JWM46_364 [Candidatus Kaiserbacteria bacterium]|nr:hypothetical protein [Candidatus Kaiserbacteria bacterium]